MIKGTRGRFGQAEAVHHLAGWSQPKFSTACCATLRQHRVRAAERDHSGFAKEKAFTKKCLVHPCISQPGEPCSTKGQAQTIEIRTARVQEGRAC